MIPKKIFQTYKTKYDDLPYLNDSKTNLKGLTESWFYKNPDYEYYYYDDELILKTLKQEDEILYKCILECDKIGKGAGAMKADIFRYFIIHKYGGFYADIDTVCKQPIDSWLDESHKIVLSPEDNSENFQQWFIGAEKGHPVLTEVLKNVKIAFGKGIDTSDPLFVLWTTGPKIWTRAILKVLGVEGERMLRERSESFNMLPKAQELGIHIYPDYKYFRNPEGVVHHLYGSMEWKNDSSYSSWQKHIN